MDFLTLGLTSDIVAQSVRVLIEVFSIGEVMSLNPPLVIPKPIFDLNLY